MSGQQSIDSQIFLIIIGKKELRIELLENSLAIANSQIKGLENQLIEKAKGKQKSKQLPNNKDQRPNNNQISSATHREADKKSKGRLLG